MVGYNRIWTVVNASHHYNVFLDDVDTCWKGIGYNACVNNRGYWHYPGIVGCPYWTDSMPREVFDSLLSGHDPLRKLIEEEPSILFSSS